MMTESTYQKKHGYDSWHHPPELNCWHYPSKTGKPLCKTHKYLGERMADCTPKQFLKYRDKCHKCDSKVKQMLCEEKRTSE